MAEEPKQFDPEATVQQPLRALDPEATVAGPPRKAEPDPEATDKHPVFDPDATVNPTEQAKLDPEATVRVPSPGRVRKNPFAPKSVPETIQANLSALGGLNPLIAMANPILGAVPQVRRALKHPDPAMLRENLRDQIESFETSAMSAEIPDAASAAAVYALCALLDESAAATPWGGSWIDKGLLQELRGESGGGEGFFKLLDELELDAEANADLLEFFYVCLALGFEGRYREAEGGRQALDQVRNSLYATISRRRPRPVDGLSAQWRSATALAAAAPALQVAAKVSAELSAQAAAQATALAGSGESTLPPVGRRAKFSLSRLPRRAIWSALFGVIGALVVFYLLALRLLENDVNSAFSTKAPAKSPAAKQAAAATPPAPAAAIADIAKALQGAPVAITENAGRIVVTLRSERQFPPGSELPAPALRPLFQRIAAALDKTPGAVVVTGYADASPTRRYASNMALSAARAQAVAQIMAPKLGDARRLTAEGKGESEPLAPSDTEANRAKNRRVAITLRPNP
ncbi:MAG TPA: type IVB secretion system protein IcmH/DotU [Burkholderiales bacterium]|jgi:type VI secretion system protein ImpK